MASPNPPDPYVGEIRLFSGISAPKNWALCDGKLLNIQDYEPLFTVIGFIYGGNNVSTFALPDLRGRVPVSQGGRFPLGAFGGQETVSLTFNQMANHQHKAYTSSVGGLEQPANNFWGPSDSNPYVPSVGSQFMNANSLSYVGVGEPHENRIPYQAICYIISLIGVIPS